MRVRLSVRPSIRLPVCPSIRLSVCPSVCLSFSMGLLLSKPVCLGLGRLTLVLFKYFCIYSTGYAPIFGGVGYGRPRCRWSSGPAFSFSSQRIWSRNQFALKTGHFLILEGWGMDVVIPGAGGHRDHHFPFPRTKYSLGIDFR